VCIEDINRNIEKYHAKRQSVNSKKAVPDFKAEAVDIPFTYVN
jgi:hypothetical protein